MGDFLGAAGEGLAFGAASQPGCWRMAWRVIKWTAIAVIVLVLLAMHHLFLALLLLALSIGWSVWKRRLAAQQQQQPPGPVFHQQPPPQRADEAEYQQWREQQRYDQFRADSERMHREINPGTDQQPKDMP